MAGSTRPSGADVTHASHTRKSLAVILRLAGHFLDGMDQVHGILLTHHSLQRILHFLGTDGAAAFEFLAALGLRGDTVVELSDEGDHLSLGLGCDGNSVSVQLTQDFRHKYIEGSLPTLLQRSSLHLPHLF